MITDAQLVALFEDANGRPPSRREARQLRDRWERTLYQAEREIERRRPPARPLRLRIEK